jgi:hypothetical protein
MKTPSKCYERSSSLVPRAWAEILSRAATAAGGPYYIRFEPPSNSGKRVRTVHRSLRTNVVAAAKARAKLIIEPTLNGQWETAEKLKSKSGYATIGDIVERYLYAKQKT